MSYLCAEIKAYDESRKIMTVAFGEQWPLKPSSATFAEVSIEDCDAIGHEVGAGDTGLTPDEASVLKLLLDECGALEDVLAHPEHLVGRACALDE